MDGWLSGKNIQQILILLSQCLGKIRTVRSNEILTAIVIHVLVLRVRHISNTLASSIINKGGLNIYLINARLGKATSRRI